MSEAYRNISKIKSDKYSVIIPAAAAGIRMRSYGPRCLIKVGERTVLDRLLEKINKRFHNNEVIVVGGFEGAKLKRRLPKGVKFVENKEYEETTSVKSISLALNHVTTNKVILINGDLVFNDDLPLFKESALVVGGIKKDGEVGCVVTNGIVQNIMYDLTPKWSQIAFFTGDELKKLKELSAIYYRTLIFEVINSIIYSGGEFKAIMQKGVSTDIDNSKDIKVAEKCIK